MHPKNISIQDYTYDLPEEKIARYPLPERDASRLLIYKNGSITEDHYHNIDSLLPANSLLIFNDTKVVEARLLFKKPTGGVIEIFCLEPLDQYGDITSAMRQQNMVLWKCLVGGASKWKRGQVLEKKIIAHDEITLHARYVEKKSDHFIIELSWGTDISFAEVLHHAGAIPLPPYIKRDAEISDAERYQTIYAHFEGSVAAPTAGLHFTYRVFQKLQIKNILTTFVTLHVGAGTFKPVTAETMQAHEMHSEYIDVSGKTVEMILAQLESGNNIIAVGTTSLRTLESLYWIGVKIIRSTAGAELFYVSQWEPYEDGPGITAIEALNAVIDEMKKQQRDHLISKTSIIIAPGYKTKIVNGLITNFHQPRSTLLLLVAALIGDDWRKVYDHALKNGFRFLSYGDGCLLWV
jgi:S-adenosylmethionine:tRNA ribosyltransferase-isomerase